MSQSKANLEVKNFQSGLRTEFSPINGSLNAVSSWDNFKLNLDGSIEVRESIVTSATAISGSTNGELPAGVRSFLWKKPNRRSTDMLVLNGSSTQFFDIDVSSGSPVLTHFQTIIDPSFEPEAYNTSMYTVINDTLVIGGSNGVTNFTFNDGGTIDKTNVPIQVNDFFGVDDETEPTTLIDNVFFVGQTVDERKAITRRNYNLMNQGFSAAQIFSAQTAFSEVSPYAAGFDATNTFSPTLIIKMNAIVGNTPAPKGKNIINLNSRGAVRNNTIRNSMSETIFADQPSATQIGGLDDYMLSDFHNAGLGGTTGISGWLTASFSGRAWYAHVRSSPFELETTAPPLDSVVAFSRSITELDRIGQCHQQNDPTSGDFSALLATDGGIITISGAKKIKALVPYQNSLLVFADEGVWEITSSGLFTAANYDVRKITDNGIDDNDNASEMIVTLQDQVIYWSADGVQVLAPNAQSGRIAATNISIGTIDSKYKELLEDELISSVYDPKLSLVRWLTKKTATGVYSELVLNTAMSSFYTYTLTELTGTTSIILGYASLDMFTSGEGSAAIMHGNNVGGEFNNLQVSYFQGNLTDIEANILTNTETFGDTAKRKNAPYLTVYLEQTEKTQTATELEDQSSCKVQTRWDFADNIVSNKFGSEFEAYRLLRFPSSATSDFVYGQSVVTTRNKLRGRGRSLAIQFRAPAGKRCHLYGYSLNVAINEDT